MAVVVPFVLLSDTQMRPRGELGGLEGMTVQDAVAKERNRFLRKDHRTVAPVLLPGLVGPLEPGGFLCVGGGTQLLRDRP